MVLRQLIQRIFICTLILLALLNSIELFITRRYSEQTGNDTISQWEERFTRLKKQLPVQGGTIGYLGDFDIQGIEINIADQETEYILAQYTMAPIVLERGTDHEWIIGNLSAEAYRAWVISNSGEYEITAFGNDLYLIHQNKP